MSPAGSGATSVPGAEGPGTRGATGAEGSGAPAAAGTGGAGTRGITGTGDSGTRGVAGAGGSTVDAVFGALADPTRRKVIVALAREPSLTASRLAGELPVTRQAVAKHLALLDRAGLVRARRAGREMRYELTPEPLGEAVAWIANVGARWDAALARLAERAGR